MGRAIDLFVTYRFLKLLTTPFEKVDAYKYGIIDKDGNRIKKKNSDEVAVDLTTSQLKNSYTILHKLVFNIKKIFAKVPGLRTKVGTYAAALFLLKDTFKEEVQNADVFEKEFVKYLKENNVELDGEISEEVVGFGEILPKGEYVLKQDILNKEEEELTAKAGDKVIAFEDEAPIDTVLGVDIFAVIHEKTKEKIYVSLEDLKSA
tara:strand:- start:159 stop:773 length:615 start_codon:yes stop_codon:yes gene_type:complete